jgi:hypothetical protein
MSGLLFSEVVRGVALRVHRTKFGTDSESFSGSCYPVDKVAQAEAGEEDVETQEGGEAS